MLFLATYHFLTLFPSSKLSVRSTRTITTPIAFMLAPSASVENQLMQIASEQETIIAILSFIKDYACDQVSSCYLFLDVAYHFSTCNSVS